MAEEFEFELIFALSEGESEACSLSDAVFEAGFEDALVGTGQSGLIGVVLKAAGDDAQIAVINAAQALINALPRGTILRDVRPDLVSLADVTDRLEIKR